MRLPKGRIIMENVRLEFVNFDRILTAGQRERAAKINGYISLTYPTESELIFLKKGEPFYAAKFSLNKKQKISIQDAVNRAKKEISGIVSIYETPLELLAILQTTIEVKPDFSTNFSLLPIDEFIQKLKETKLNGFIEIQRDIDLYYFVFENGNIKISYPAGKPPKEITENELKKAFEIFAKTESKISLWKEIIEISSLATPAQVELLLNALSHILSTLAQSLTHSLVMKITQSILEQEKKSYPFLENLKISEDFKTEGNFSEKINTLVEAFGKLTFRIVSSLSTMLGPVAKETALKSVKDYYFALENLGFFKYFKIE